MNPFKRDPPVRLKQSELLVLKELASFFLNVDFQGSQLEELLRARAPQASQQAENTPSILTPTPVSNPPPASESEASASTSTTPQSTPKAEPKANSTGPTGTRRRAVDNAFQHSKIGVTDPTKSYEINSYTDCGEETTCETLEDNSFTHSDIAGGSTVNHRSFNNNVGCRITTSNTTRRFTNFK